MNPRDNEREFGAMLRRGLASGAAAPESECLDAALLAAYYERSLAADELRACDSHVANCAHCRSQLAAMARAEPERGDDDARSKSWLWDWRLLVPITAALTVLVVWIGVRRPGQMRSASQRAPIVAQNEAPAAAPQSAPPPSSQMVEVFPAPPATRTKKIAPPSAQRSTAAGSYNSRKSQPTTGRAVDKLAVPGIAAEERDEKTRGKDFERGNADGVAGGIIGGVPPPRNAEQKSPNAPVQTAQAQPAAGGAATSTTEVVVVQPPPSPARSSGAATSNAVSGRGGGFSGRAGNAAGGSAAKEKRAAPANGANAQAAPNMQAAQAAPAPIQSVTARYKQDESKPIVIPTPDANTFWRVAGTDEIQFTNDVGATWQSQLTEPQLVLTAGSAPKANVCSVVGSSGTILRTVDGENWQRVKSPTSQDLTGVPAQDTDTASITAKDGSVFTTKDGGANWSLAAVTPR